jgi:hypothetical protein
LVSSTGFLISAAGEASITPRSTANAKNLGEHPVGGDPRTIECSRHRILLPDMPAGCYNSLGSVQGISVTSLVLAQTQA